MQIKFKHRIARDTHVDAGDVMQLKKALNRLDCYQPPEKTGITTLSDANMFDGLKKFQILHDLPVTGTINPNDPTEQALQKAAATTPDGSYIWRTAADEKVRAEQAQFNRTIRLWSDAPDPGEDFNCRCWAEALSYDPPIEPVYPELLLLPALRGGNLISVGIKAYVQWKNKQWKIDPPRPKLQHEYKHVRFFSVNGNVNNKNLQAFKDALNRHVNTRDTQVIKGTYHKQEATHYFNPARGLML